MPTTRMTATNTLNKGLVMDFNPAITKDDCLVNALNATLLTFNGNEMQLQQDMGNGRVETAYLPEGFIPVGTCEFGDIIYVVSYNPLENKSQIGCFPSPERNITSDEISDMQQSLSVNDFQELEGGSPTGVIKATSVKKIVYGNKNMNPGDKYIIYEEGAENSALKTNKNTLTDYGNTSHQLETWPKLLRLKVVSIEDSGKIVDLGASVKWYDSDYYLAELNKQVATGKPDIDSYRSLVSSAYSVFQSKISGKLAILAELESIDGFSCTYDVYTTVENGKTKYQIYFYTAWETSHNDVNPSGFIVTKSAWTDSKDGGKIILPQKSGDIIKYVTSNAQSQLPIATGFNGTKYDASKVFEYTKLYNLEKPSSTFDTYQSTDSFNAKLPSIVEWNANSLEAGDVGKKDKLRPITKVTRLLNITDGALGEPITDSSGRYSYVFNLDSYSADIANKIVEYKTKASDGELLKLKPIILTDDVVNNYFGKDIPKLVSHDYELQTSVTLEDNNGNDVVLDSDLTNLVWNYAVAPVMPYGVLDYLETSGTIDFSKLGKGQIDLTAWRYYTAGNVSTLTWGLDAYVEQNKGIAEVVMDFFDNQGIAASYHVFGKTSFAGMFTEHIVLGQQNSSYRLDSTDAYGNSYKHAGAYADEGDSDVVYLNNANKVSATNAAFGPFKNDAGTLYPNMLYLVRITVKYCSKDLMGNFVAENTSSYKTFYRWMWTNGIFNEQYYNTDDFINLKPSLSIDFSATFSTKGDGGTNPMKAVEALYMDRGTPSYTELEAGLFKTIGANVYGINQDGADDTNGNILLTLNPGLAEGFNTFNLNKAHLTSIDKIKIQLGNSKITKSVDAPGLIHTGQAHIHPLDDNIQPITATILDSHDTGGMDRSGYAAYHYGLNNSYVSDDFLELLNSSLTQKSFTAHSGTEGTATATVNSSKEELYGSAEAYKAYLDSFSVNLIGGTFQSTGNLEYTDSDGQQHKLTHWTEKTIDMDTAINTGVKMVLAGVSLSKLYASEYDKDSTSKILNSIIYKSSGEYNSPEAAGLKYYSGHMYFKKVVSWLMGESGGKETRWGSDFYELESSGKGWGTWKQGDGHSSHNEWNPDFDNGEIQGSIKPWVTLPVVGFTICRSGSGNGKIKNVYSDVSWARLRSSFGAGSNGNNIYDSSDSCPVSSKLGSTGTRVVHTFAVYDQELNLVVPMADYFVGSNTSQDKLGGYPITTTLADMLGSLFAQLYVVDEEGDANMALIKNFVTLQDYVETWNKDIIVQVDTSTGKLANQADIQKLITIQTQTAESFINHVKANSGLTLSTDEWSQIEDNVTINLYGTQRVITFQFGVPYNLGNLLYIYNQKGTSQNKINLSVLDNSDNPVTENFTGNVTANTLYTWTGENIVPFGQGSSMTYASEFTEKDGRIYMKAGSRKMKSSSFATLAKVLQYEGGELTWHNLSQFSTWNSKYRIRYSGTGDDPGIKALPMVSIFNEYKPGM